MTQAVKEEYLAGVDRALLCYLPKRKELMAEARRMVEQFAEENPEATGEDLLAAFGTGEEFALSMLSTVPQRAGGGGKAKNRFPAQGPTGGCGAGPGGDRRVFLLAVAEDTGSCQRGF